MNPSHKGILYAVFSGLLYGCIGYFGVGLLDEGFSVSAMLFWRFLGASLCFIPFLLPRLKKLDLNLNQILLAVINGIVAFGGTSLFFFFASEYIGTGLAMVVFFAYPAIVAIANWGFHGHRFTLLYAISFAILFLGLFLLIDLHEVTLDIVGILLGLLSGLCYALYVLLSKKQTASMDPFFFSFLVSIGCALFFGIYAGIEGTFIKPENFVSLGHIAGIAILATALPIYFLMKALNYINTTKASILGVLEPLGTLAVGVFLLSEPVTFMQVLGSLTILAGALLIQFDTVNHKGH